MVVFLRDTNRTNERFGHVATMAEPSDLRWPRPVAVPEMPRGAACSQREHEAGSVQVGCKDRHSQMRRLLLVLIVAVATHSTGCAHRTQSIGRAEFYWLMNRACSWGDKLGVEMLLKAGADPDGVRDYDAFHKSYQRGYEPSWPINQAAYGGHAEVVDLLLRAGARAHLPEGEGQTALTTAAERGHLQVVRLLLAAGVDETYRGPGAGGFVGTAEEIARRSGHAEVAETIRSFRSR